MTVWPILLGAVIVMDLVVASFYVGYRGRRGSHLKAAQTALRAGATCYLLIAALYGLGLGYPSDVSGYFMASLAFIAAFKLIYAEALPGIGSLRRRFDGRHAQPGANRGAS